MTREPSDTTRILAFIREHVAETGQFPTNKQISDGCDVFPWRIAGRLSQLVDKGYIARTQIGEKGTIRQPKYRYVLLDTRELA